MCVVIASAYLFDLAVYPLATNGYISSEMYYSLSALKYPALTILSLIIAFKESKFIVPAIYSVTILAGYTLAVNVGNMASINYNVIAGMLMAIDIGLFINGYNTRIHKNSFLRNNVFNHARRLLSVVGAGGSKCKTS